MTDKMFFHPETGKPLHLVPIGATIPAGTPYGIDRTSGFLWVRGGVSVNTVQNPESIPRWTAEPIAAPTRMLPTIYGALVRATSIKGEVCEVMTLDTANLWVGVDHEGGSRYWSPDYIADWSLVRVEPNDTGVLDETDKRDRDDRDGYTWRWDIESDTWWCPTQMESCGSLASLNRDQGPLTFADGTDQPNCCCQYGASISGEYPEFGCAACPIHRGQLGETELCRHHRGDAS